MGLTILSLFSEDSFCMVVHTCSVDDGRGETSFLIDSNGCSIDKFLLSNLEYPGNLLAGQEAHVYKFADRDALFFQCQISITVKEPDQECVRPICEDVEGGGAPVVGPPPYGMISKNLVNIWQKNSFLTFFKSPYMYVVGITNYHNKAIQKL